MPLEQHASACLVSGSFQARFKLVSSSFQAHFRLPRSSTRRIQVFPALCDHRIRKGRLPTAA
jgi:hypothetical protein